MLVGTTEGFGTKTGGGSYLGELLPATFSVESFKGDLGVKEVGRPVCEEVRAGGVMSL